MKGADKDVVTKELNYSLLKTRLFQSYDVVVQGRFYCITGSKVLCQMTTYLVSIISASFSYQAASSRDISSFINAVCFLCVKEVDGVLPCFGV